MDENLNITDLLDVDVLQRVQDAFSQMTGISTLTADRNGVAVTNGTNFSDFCQKYTRASKVGGPRCELCDKCGAELALEAGKAVTYTCHAGLVDFAAPIRAKNRLVGCFMGGQVLVEEPDYDLIRKNAAEFGVDPDEYIKAVQEIPRVSQEQVDRGAEFLYTISSVLSDIAYSKYLAQKAKKDIERAANMKSDFLANMSHEIRTPMNAVIGMAEMALREELSPTARDYINQIKSSGKALLTIINDILDFSKIESGKMDIVEVEYEPMSIINDISNIIMTRIGDKDVELILDIAPNIPHQIFGDNIRIKQIIINLANNAVKFTQTGQVLLRMGYERIDEKELKLCVWIEDTGIGIKKEDLGKLFQSFQQLDSKRNRNIEGTGLGLAISKQLLSLMGGYIGVTSEYEKGSRFFFELPQKIIDDTPSILVKDHEKDLVVDLMSNKYINEQLRKDSRALGANYIHLESMEDLENLQSDKRMFLFMEQKNLTPMVEDFIREHPEMTGVLLIEFNVKAEYRMDNLLVIKKPIYALNLSMILNNEGQHIDSMNNDEEDFDFIAPDAHVLIVDDNTINLTVAEGLLEPLKLQIDTALSGREAIGKISAFKYDLILMDHMMPELDGVETTHIIRRFHEEYNDVPIIALTANAVDGTKEMFMKEGMNDFVAKPIEMRILASKIKQWLDPEKVKKEHWETNSNSKAKTELPPIGDLDIEYSLGLLGSEDLFWSVLGDYYRVIEKKAALIKKLEEEEDWPAYTIQVHALKSASKQIGALSLSDRAADMEKAGNERNSARIHENTDAMLIQYRAYLDILAEYFPEEQETDEFKEDVTWDVLTQLFENMRIALDDLDMDEMEEVAVELKKYNYRDAEKELLEKLLTAVEELDVDSCEEIMSEWEGKN